MRRVSETGILIARLGLLLALATGTLAAPAPAGAEAPPGAEAEAVEVALPEGRVAEGLALGPDGNLWFGLSGVGVGGSAEIGEMTAAGATLTFAVPASAPGASGDPTTSGGITAGAEGRLWFGSTAGAGGALGSISTAGEVGLVALAHPGREPTSIAAGAGGAIWSTISAGHYRSWVGELAPGGAVHEYPIPGREFAEGIAAGPGGAMWFLASTPGRSWPPGAVLGKVDGAGRVSRWPVPGGGLTSGIAGSGGRIWFGVEGEEPVIASADRRGRIRELALPAPRGESGYVDSIAPAPGGGVWFVGNDPQILGQVSAGGEIRRTLLQAQAGFFGSLTVGGEGRLWATTGGESLLAMEPRIAGSRLRQLGALGRGGAVRVRVHCERSGRGCHGTIRISHQRTGETCCGPIEVAFARYRIAAGATRVVSVIVPAAARADLVRAARRGHLVSVGAFEPGGFAASRTLEIAGVGVRAG